MRGASQTEHSPALKLPPSTSQPFPVDLLQQPLFCLFRDEVRDVPQAR
eukprot:CAMPEP_0194779308 /NCGR_PEP_ID=MMETSP0323_2-20130528/70700_1 /TAXON_ID=2866 ORGANISM="Crypthecodinium cohnii, Strain Seligo" /NCGR_SAMPLE_ID=MMETSP0323_2 /ASSEMBLY_ACC=CAM_ASM_000346 /LENGTH=47 /DNA_ID= /DNA_START= /DNA_END= /DNA_ORIENTATION=